MFNLLRKRDYVEKIPDKQYTAEQLDVSAKLVKKMKKEFEIYKPIEWIRENHYPFPCTYHHKKCQYYIQQKSYADHNKHITTSYGHHMTVTEYVDGLVHSVFKDYFTKKDAVELLEWFNAQRNLVENKIMEDKNNNTRIKLNEFIQNV